MNFGCTKASWFSIAIFRLDGISYIAGFFAFNEKHADERVAIYAFIETPRGIKSGGSEPQITVLGPYTPSHKRHFIQQSNYTVCVKAQNNEHEFISHETVFQKRRNARGI